MLARSEKKPLSWGRFGDATLNLETYLLRVKEISLLQKLPLYTHRRSLEVWVSSFPRSRWWRELSIWQGDSGAGDWEKVTRGEGRFKEVLVPSQVKPQDWRVLETNRKIRGMSKAVERMSWFMFGGWQEIPSQGAAFKGWKSKGIPTNCHTLN